MAKKKDYTGKDANTWTEADGYTCPITSCGAVHKDRASRDACVASHAAVAEFNRTKGHNE